MISQITEPRQVSLIGSTVYAPFAQRPADACTLWDSRAGGHLMWPMSATWTSCQQPQRPALSRGPPRRPGLDGLDGPSSASTAHPRPRPRRPRRPAHSQKRPQRLTLPRLFSLDLGGLGGPLSFGSGLGGPRPLKDTSATPCPFPNNSCGSPTPDSTARFHYLTRAARQRFSHLPCCLRTRQNRIHLSSSPRLQLYGTTPAI